MPRPTPLTEEEVKKIVLNSIVSRTFKYSNHLFDRVEERNLSVHDVSYICQNGKLVAPEWNTERLEWRYPLQCKALDGIETAVFLKIPEDQYYVVAVTIFSY